VPGAHEPPQTEQPAEEAAEDSATDEIVVTGRRVNLLGQATTASEGRVGREDLEARPLLRSGDLLEFVPGLVATQHSGSGKANQYFLRGFNLDHGTDFATSVDGMPVNMRTHGHGQGWTDLNFLIPEAVEELSYAKGVYLTEAGDFSSAGSARFKLASSFARNSAEISAGADGYRRAVLLGSRRLGPGNILLAGEVQRFDGPWTDIKEGVRKTNALLRYSAPLGGGEWQVTAMAYDNRWRSPDQIPMRAVSNGQVDEYGSIDPTLGGKSSRFSISGGWNGAAAGGELRASAYAIRSKLNLFSNFTYFLDDPANGDQFRQVDDRTILGFEVRQDWAIGAAHVRMGMDGRFDDIGRVGLYRTAARQPLSTVREDAVRQSSIGLHASYEVPLTERLRTTFGARYDAFWANVDARSLPINSGRSNDDKLSFKGNLAYRVSQPFELYASYGQGFHSNDARGTTIRVDPLTGEAATRVAALVGTRGGELGLRWFPGKRLHASAAFWRLELGSELVFVGDAGGTEASRPSRRQGVELGLYLLDDGRLSGELELSYTRSRFRGLDPAGQQIPGSIPLVVSAGLNWKPWNGWSIAPRFRYVGRYPLIEDNSVRARSSTLVNLRIGRDWGGFGVGLDLFNLLDSKDHDIDYFYASRLQGEPSGGVEDVHYHVFQPRSARLTFRARM
jgi:outer membrane receptor protein involved in Fe transport